MGFNHRQVSNILQVHKELDELGLDKFIKQYHKCDAISGDSESVYFIKNLVEKYYNEKNNNDIVIVTTN
jgi:hypothetical protein